MPGAIRPLLARSIDYAGLFPPCSLQLERALANHDGYMRSADEWMLSTFVLPTARFGEADVLVTKFEAAHPLRVSALGSKKESPGEFISELRIARDAIAGFKDRHGELVSIPQLEMALPRNTDAGVLAEMRGILTGFECQAFWEAAANEADETIDLLAENNAETDGRTFGFKLRTGGVTADAFPTSQQIARALVAAMQRHVPIKFTAGLHHPIRQHRDEVGTKMHGFLNVLGAGVLAAQHQWSEKQTIEMLECEEGGAFGFDENSFRWREWSASSAEIEKHRRLITSFGSCSFDEPREDLRALGML